MCGYTCQTLSQQYLCSFPPIFIPPSISASTPNSITSHAKSMSNPTFKMPSEPSFDTAFEEPTLPSVSELHEFGNNIMEALDEAERELDAEENHSFNGMGTEILRDVAKLREEQFQIYHEHIALEEKYKVEDPKEANEDISKMSFSKIASSMRQKEADTVELLAKLETFDYHFRDMLEKFGDTPTPSEFNASRRQRRNPENHHSHSNPPGSSTNPGPSTSPHPKPNPGPKPSPHPSTNRFATSTTPTQNHTMFSSGSYETKPDRPNPFASTHTPPTTHTIFGPSTREHRTRWSNPFETLHTASPSSNFAPAADEPWPHSLAGTGASSTPIQIPPAYWEAPTSSTEAETISAFNQVPSPPPHTRDVPFFPHVHSTNKETPPTNAEVEAIYQGKAPKPEYPPSPFASTSQNP